MEAAGHPAAPLRPGEGDVLFWQCSIPVQRYFDEPPDREALGDVPAGCLYAGTGVQHIELVETTAALVARLWAETQRQL